MSDETEKQNRKTEITIFKTPPAWVLGGAFLIMLAAKVFNYSDLSWWIVTVPLWGPLAICFGIFSFLVVVAVVGCTIFFTAALIIELFKRIFSTEKNRKENDDDYKLHS